MGARGQLGTMRFPSRTAPPLAQTQRTHRHPDAWGGPRANLGRVIKVRRRASAAALLPVLLALLGPPRAGPAGGGGPALAPAAGV